MCFFFKQKTAYEMRISDWSSDVCSSDLRAFPGDTAILVGSSVGSMIVPCMHDRRPDRSSALVLCGAGHKPNLDFSARIRAYREEGMDYRWRFTFQDFSPALDRKSTRLNSSH